MKTCYAFEIKRVSDGNIERCKSRFVGKGYPQCSRVVSSWDVQPSLRFLFYAHRLSCVRFAGVVSIGTGLQASILSGNLAEIWLELPGGGVLNPRKMVQGFRHSAMEWWKELRRRIGDSGWKNSAHDECL